MIPKLAWRNVWRNRKRSLITIASIFFAVFFAIAMRAIQLGTYDRMIDNVVNSFSGYIQVHERGYWDDQVIDNAMVVEDLPDRITASVEGVTAVYPRIQSFVLTATDEKTKGALAIGLDFAAEEPMLKLSRKLVAGRLPEEGSDGLLVGSGLAASLRVQPGDTLVLLGQGYRGSIAAGKYVVSGILKFPSPALDNSLVFLPFKTGQELFDALGMATALIVQIDDRKDNERVFDQIESLIDSTSLTAMTWQEMLPELVQTIQADKVGGLIMVMILYVVISFGIFGTLLMMMNERSYEFGVLLSLGMTRGKIMATTLLELFILALIGAAASVIIAYPLQMYFKVHPVLLLGRAAESLTSYGFEPVIGSSTDVMISLTQMMGILAVTAVISIYAVWRLYRMKPVEAMRQ